MKVKEIDLKITIVLIATFLLCVSTKAQELKYSVMVGLNLVNMSLSNASSNGFHYDAYPDITGSVNAIIGFKSDDWWEISLEPGYIKKGGVLDLTYSDGYNKISSQNSRDYSNIVLPILLNIDLNRKFYLSAGIGLDYTISSSKNNEFRAVPLNYIPAGSTDNQYGIYTLPNDDILPNLNNKMSCSAILGVSYKLNDTYDVCLRYGLGLTKLATVNLISNINNSTYSNYLQLALKYNIN